MKLVALTEFLIKSLVKDSDNISITHFDEENELIIEVLVSQEDMGRVIGKNGRNISSIRTLVQAASYMNENKKIIINVEAF